MTKVPSALQMVEDLAKDHSYPVTAELITGRSAFHEKEALMLRATAR